MELTDQDLDKALSCYPDPARLQVISKNMAFISGFYAGFMISREGFNAEYAAGHCAPLEPEPCHESKSDYIDAMSKDQVFQGLLKKAMS